MPNDISMILIDSNARTVFSKFRNLFVLPGLMLALELLEKC